jgi:hypothetical protein
MLQIYKISQFDAFPEGGSAGVGPPILGAKPKRLEDSHSTQHRQPHPGRTRFPKYGYKKSASPGGAISNKILFGDASSFPNTGGITVSSNALGAFRPLAGNHSLQFRFFSSENIKLLNCAKHYGRKTILVTSIYYSILQCQYEPDTADADYVCLRRFRTPIRMPIPR